MATVYIDVLFLTNLIINFILIAAAARLSGIKLTRVRAFFGAALGAIYAVCIFFPALSALYSVAAKLIVSMLMVSVAFKLYTVKGFFKALLCFYLVSFGLGGAALALFYFTDLGAKMGAVYSNGILYFNLPWQILFVSALGSYALIQITGRVFSRSLVREKLKMPLYISLSGKTAEMTALLDSGNSLFDPLSGSPVIVAEYAALRPILPEAAQRVFENMSEADIGDAADQIGGCGLKIRAIPFSSLGRERGMLLGFKPDGASVFEKDGAREINDCIVGVYNRNLSGDKSYNALLGINMLR